MGAAAAAVLAALKTLITLVGVKPIRWAVRIMLKLIGKKIEKRVEERHS